MIKSVSGTVATCQALNNFYTETGVRYYQTGAFDTVSGYVKVAVYRVFTCRYPLLGDITAGSAVIANVGRADTYFSPTEVAAGDFLLVNEYTFRPFTEGAKINSLDTGARTITMSGAAAYTQARVPLVHWVRAPL